jgi:hypothetical protein
MVTTNFFVYTDDINNLDSVNDGIKERFLLDYPDATITIDYDSDEELHNITLDINDLSDIEDIDTFLCEEICQEFEYYCTISDGDKSKSYYFDEDDEWSYK